ncbi:phosphatidylserine/phosphatidylglycerophosphate/cardiolipin synthase-like enzyme [Rhizomicrobium palustre]|uniref:Phospholipase D n=1 Tax=Rhizomicrobium palustre TaxID=189966 RepID=A0A846MVS0_9PROT|nr:phospholipase D-like domain-containing protein [Rhizomicrobium palustre]NIK87097.1 phosphatidylserine/phosphatidylglycerophosphate/cardiolipin synthase-like enzyme [Rhizomicrobium palustre]
MRGMKQAGLAAGLCALVCLPANAEFAIPGFELVHTLPVGAGLNPLDVRDAATVWCEMIDHAKTSIDLEQFYATSEPGSALDKVISRLEAAAARGVKIRFLMENVGNRMSDTTTLARLKAIKGIEFRELAFADVSGDGIIHAKFFVVDGKSAFVGSHNFDWRALEHIDETGLKIDDKTMVSELAAIFVRDWEDQARIAAGKPVQSATDAKAAIIGDGQAVLVASPADHNPAGVADSQAMLVDLIAHAKKNIRITVMEYSPLGQKRQYYPVIDTALRAASQRGVKIELLVANWNLSRFKQPYLKSLAVLPNVDLRVVTIPEAQSGFIPFARVVHTKTMTIDDEIAWVGTSNWEGGYFDHSRNIEIVLKNPAMAAKLNALHDQLWQAPFTKPLEITRDYPAPHPGTP